MTTPLIDLTKLHELQERYPFNDAEMEILIRCYESIHNECYHHEGFLVKLALASPYSYFFLPGNEMRRRVTWIEDQILPRGFSDRLESAMNADVFVEYANQGIDLTLESFLEGVARTGRRGYLAALHMIFDLVPQPTSRSIADMCIRLSVAAEIVTDSNFDENSYMARLDNLESAIDAIDMSLATFVGQEAVTKYEFVQWAQKSFPLLSTPFSTFVHNLLLHGHAYPHYQVSHSRPRLVEDSHVFSSDMKETAPLVLSFLSPQLGGKWHRLYSSFTDGRSFNRMEWSILGYKGPTLLAVRTTQGSILGAYSNALWKESKEFQDFSETFLYTMSPSVKVFWRDETGESNVVYLHSKCGSNASNISGQYTGSAGLGFGGSLGNPRLFIPEGFGCCKARSFDRTFLKGDMLPIETLETFEIMFLEFWAVGGDDVYSKGLENRRNYRDAKDTAISKARTVRDKSDFAKDLREDASPTSLFSHLLHTRGRHEFRVDDVHGGYALEQK